jgi:antitoxin ParD1/3/4
MAMNEKISIALPPQMIDEIKARVDTGLYDSASDVLQAALRALDREESVFDQNVDAKIRQALDDDRPGSPANEVFERLELIHAANKRRD